MNFCDTSIAPGGYCEPILACPMGTYKPICDQVLASSGPGRVIKRTCCYGSLDDVSEIGCTDTSAENCSGGIIWSSYGDGESCFVSAPESASEDTVSLPCHGCAGEMALTCSNGRWIVNTENCYTPANCPTTTLSNNGCSLHGFNTWTDPSSIPGCPNGISYELACVGSDCSGTVTATCSDGAWVTTGNCDR